MRHLRLIFFLTLSALFGTLTGHAQELEARVVVNHQKIQGTNTSVFEQLETSLTEFLNERQWTNMQFQRNEKIRCNFNITINKYDESAHSIEAMLAVQSTRPVYNSSYTTTVFAIQDPDFNFSYQEFDELNFRADVIDNNLTATIAFYVYLIIGLDMETMGLNGGTEHLETALSIANNSQGLNTKGWKAFEDSKNRYAIINDLLDGGMKPFREMLYGYHRLGLDIMAENAERGRAAISEVLTLLGQAHTDKPMSMLPQIFTEYKRDELVNIYAGKGTPRDKEALYEMLMSIDASQRPSWAKIKQ